MSEAWKRNLAVPFFTQRDNTYIWQQVATEDKKDENGKYIKRKGKPFGFKYPMAWRSCNITSLCMLLHYWGITDKTPNQMIEEVYSNTEWNWSTSVTGYEVLEYWKNLKKIAEHYISLTGEESFCVNWNENNKLSMSLLQEQIGKGCPVMISTGLGANFKSNKDKDGNLINEGYKRSGHIVVVRGFTDKGDVILNDPYGIPVENDNRIRQTGTSSNTNGYYYLSKAAAVGDNIIISRNDFEKVYAEGTPKYLYIEGPLWQQPCEPMTEPDAENCYPIKTNNYWHDGIHLQSAEGFRSIGSGRLVAARNADVAGEGEEAHGSGSFALVRYQLPVSETPFFYALYMHLSTLNLKSELETFMKTGSVSEQLRGTWYEQIFNNLLPRYKIFSPSLSENFSGENYNAIYEAKIIEEENVVKIEKTNTLVDFGDGTNGTGILSRHMKAYLLPIEKFKTICDIESYSDIKNLRFMVSVSEADFKSSDGYYFFYCGNGSGRKLCCCKNEKINNKETFAPYKIYNEASYSYYVKKLYSLYKGEVVNFHEKMPEEKVEKLSMKLLLSAASSIWNRNISYDNCFEMLVSEISSMKTTIQDCLIHFNLTSQKTGNSIKEEFKDKINSYKMDRKQLIIYKLKQISRSLDSDVAEDTERSKTDKEWMIYFFQSAERKLKIKENLGKEGEYDANGDYWAIRNAFKLVTSCLPADSAQLIAAYEYLLLSLISISPEQIKGGGGCRFYPDKTITISWLLDLWGNAFNDIVNCYTLLTNRRYIDTFIEIPKGAKIGYGSKIPESKTADSIHFEIFSGENLLKDSEELVVDFEDEDNFYTPKEITKAIFDTNCFTEEYKKINLSHVKNSLLTSDDIKKIYTEESAFQRLISCHISEWEKLNYRKESVKSMFNIKKKGQHKEKADLEKYFEEIYNKYCWFNKNLLNKDDKKITDKLYFYHPAYFIKRLSTDGSFSSPSGKADEAAIKQIDFVDEEGSPIKNDINLFVNLEKNTCMSKDNINDSLRCRIKFSQQGNFKYSLRLNKIKNAVEYSESEKKYFSTILYTDKKIEFTGSQDSTINLTDFFSFGQIGGAEFKIEAEYNGKTVETDYTVTVWRLLYLNVFNGAGLYINMDNIKKTFEKYYLKLEVLNQKTIETKSILSHSTNDVYPSEIESFIKAQIDKSFDNSFTLNLFLVKNIMSTDFHEYNVPNPSDIVELNLFNERLFLSSYPEEDWFCYAYYIDIEGQTVYLKKENFTVLKEKNLLYGLRLDLSGRPKKISTVKLNLKRITDIKSGLSFNGKNYAVFATEILGEKIAMLDIEHTCIHEIGHKLGLVSDGEKGLDKGFYHYSGRGHLGNHCHYGTNLVSNFENRDSLEKSKCIMFGTTNKSTDFCESCGNTLIKGDFSNGITRK